MSYATTLPMAAPPGVRLTTRIETFPLSAANDALHRLRDDAIRGAAVLDMTSG
jgi:D-arabinose 1-dehydrogenase-like Zn-dependent alcohol dehydrogenase